MARFLTQAWLDRWLELGGQLDERPDVSLVLQYEVTGHPQGTFRFFHRLERGKVVDARVGGAASPDLVIRTSFEDGVSWARDRVPMAWFYVHGRATVEGDVEKFVRWASVLEAPDYQRQMGVLLDETTFDAATQG